MSAPLLLPTGEFPFEFLHAEIVNFMFKEEEEDAARLAAETEKKEKEISSGGKSSQPSNSEPETHPSAPAKRNKRLSLENSFGKGVYVIQDNKFWLLAPFSTSHQYRDLSPRYLAFSCGLMRGSLANLSIQAVVTASVENMPAVKFNIHIQQK